jgi:hypothetical protein
MIHPSRKNETILHHKVDFRNLDKIISYIWNLRVMQTLKLHVLDFDIGSCIIQLSLISKSEYKTILSWLRM